MTAVLDARSAAVVADQAEAAAYADLWRAAPDAIRTALGLELRERNGATCLLAPRLPVPMFNRVIGLGMSQPASLDDVHTLARHFSAAGSRDWWLHWSPFAVPAGLDATLLGQGWTLPSRSRWAKMLWRGGAAPELVTDLRIAPARDDQVAAVTQAIIQAFGMPPPMAGWLAALHRRERWRVYAACDAERVVGGACLYLNGAMAWLGMGAILDTHRRRGGQRALMALRISDARAAGCAHIVTETGEPVGDEPNPSFANMRRIGFECVASRLNLAPPA